MSFKSSGFFFNSQNNQFFPFFRGCLYCRDVIQPTRSEYLGHLYSKHFLQLGKSENLVFIDELIDIVELKMKNLVCLYCEKIFKDRMTLKEHMRKKGHKRINPENKFYDRFFLTNYYKDRAKPPAVQLGEQVTPRKVRQDSSRVFQTDHEDSDWSDWEVSENLAIKCLFCDVTEAKIDELKTHMHHEHHFSFDAETKGLNFYKRVKLVNYIRHQMGAMQCVNCDLKVAEQGTLLSHMKAEKHFSVTCEKRYNQPEFFFPTIDDDPFLCFIEDVSEEGRVADDDSAFVICEESTVKLNEEAENLVKETLLQQDNSI